MKPNITNFCGANIGFHNVADVVLTPITKMESTAEHPSFAYRDVLLTDENGGVLTIRLFGRDMESLTAEVQPTIVEPETVPPAYDPKTGKVIPW